jgi:hypothetical protein
MLPMPELLDDPFEVARRTLLQAMLHVSRKAFSQQPGPPYQIPAEVVFFTPDGIIGKQQ